MSRIVAGVARGRRLAMPAGQGTRPTSDRLREAFFGALVAWNGTADAGSEHALDEIAFLDLFAGSGAVGLEAASRGASPVWLVENDAKVVSVIRENLVQTGLRAVVQQRSVAQVVQGAATQRFDVVWLDPPYAMPTATVNDLVVALFDNGWVADDGIVVVERARRSDPIEVVGHEQWSRKYGDTIVWWIAAGNEPDSTGDQVRAGELDPDDGGRVHDEGSC